VTSHVSITSIVASQRQAATSERKGAVMDAVIERALAHGRA
jgi:hypothetical protein